MSQTFWEGARLEGRSDENIIKDLTVSLKQARISLAKQKGPPIESVPLDMVCDAIYIAIEEQDPSVTSYDVLEYARRRYLEKHKEKDEFPIKYSHEWLLSVISANRKLDRKRKVSGMDYMVKRHKHLRQLDNHFKRSTFTRNARGVKGMIDNILIYKQHYNKIKEAERILKENQVLKEKLAKYESDKDEMEEMSADERAYTLTRLKNFTNKQAAQMEGVTSRTITTRANRWRKHIEGREVGE